VVGNDPGSLWYVVNFLQCEPKRFTFLWLLSGLWETVRQQEVETKMKARLAAKESI
jgi:hypothetical protein